ncbi:hypothetical protein Tco_1300395 [Tanacetum coccineum]
MIIYKKSIDERALHKREHDSRVNERQLQIQQCKVQEVQSSVTSSGDETSSGIVSDEEIEKKELEAPLRFHGKDSGVLTAESRLVLHPNELTDPNVQNVRNSQTTNEPSSSKYVPKVVPLAVKTATSRQELELLFHHHIAMLRTTGNKPTKIELDTGTITTSV